MITINLRPGQKRKRPGGGKAMALGQLKDLATRVKDPLLLAAVGVWVLVVGFLGWAFLSNNRTLNGLNPQLEQAQQEQKTFADLMKQKRQAERIRDSLLAQIGTIRTVDGDRYVWPHIMDEVAKAIPPYTWLTDVHFLGSVGPVDSSDTAPKPMQFEMEGRTVDIQAYTRFLRQLEASPWVEQVTPLAAKTVIEKERPVTSFTIRANFRRADSAYIRTVPLTQSVR
jgi:Tfp pilus assembly protein PilN